MQKLLYITHDFTAQYVDDFEELPFDSDTLRRHVERLITVSAPLQAFISDLRRIYRWEDPARTGRWMALYFFLWYISHVMTFFVSLLPSSIRRPGTKSQSMATSFIQQSRTITIPPLSETSDRASKER